MSLSHEQGSIKIEEVKEKDTDGGGQGHVQEDVSMHSGMSFSLPRLFLPLPLTGWE
jgi:hypothetical protein